MKTVLRRVFAAIFMLTVTFAPASSVCAQPETEQAADGTQATDEAQTANETGETEEERELSEIEIRKRESYSTLPETNELAGWPQGPKVYANSAIVMDMDSGTVLYGKKIDDRHYPASITKLLTELIALENADMGDEVVFSQESIDILRSDYASIGMKPGEILSMKDSMYAMLLASANEVSYAIAENVGEKMGGGYDTFIREMNERSEQLGCTGSHWTNANGLHDKEHYTTAHDMALITSALYQYDEFQTIAQTLNYTIGATNLVDEARTFQQHHKMLMPENSNYYKYCTGGKTGYTDDARSTLVTTADNGTLRLVAVVLRDVGDVYEDTRAMLDYAFDSFSKQILREQEIPDEISFYNNAESYVLLPSGISVSDLEYEIEVKDEKEAFGEITFYYSGQEVGSASATLTPEYVEEATGYTTRLRLVDDEQPGAEDGAKKGSFLIPGRRLLVVAGGVVLFVAALTIIVYRYRAAKSGRLRKAKRRKRQQRKTKNHGAGFE